MRTEIELAKVKARDASKKFGAAAAMLALAILMALGLLWWLFHSVELAFALLVPDWAAALITAGILLILVVVFAAIGALLIARGSEEMPDVTGTLQANVQAIQEGLQDDDLE